MAMKEIFLNIQKLFRQKKKALAGPLTLSLKPFENLPGPKSIPIFGTLYLYLPFIGPYSFRRLHRNGLLKYKQFGPLVKEQIIPGVSLLFLFDPKDIEEMFANEGRYPMRRSHVALEKYRLDRPYMYTHGGLIPTNGEDWWKIRKASQKVMNRMTAVRSRLSATDEIARELINFIRRIRQTQSCVIEDCLPIFQRAFLEITASVFLDTTLGCLRTEVLDPESEVSMLIKASGDSNTVILKLDNTIPFWRLFPTPMFRKLVRGQDFIYKMSKTIIEEKEKQRETHDQNVSSLLDYFLTSDELNRKEVVTVVCDVLLAGIDTGAFSLSYLLYNLAKNKENQEILAHEACSLLAATNGVVTSDVLISARYAKACLKESLRLKPVSVGIGRIAPNEMTIGGYRIPKGTVLVTQNQVSCSLEDYFPNAESFIPERWMDKGSSRENIHPFLLLPFGHGPRSCIGRRVAEQSLHTLIIQIMKNFDVSWLSGELDSYSVPLNTPDRSLKFSFSDRTH